MPFSGYIYKAASYACRGGCARDEESSVPRFVVVQSVARTMTESIEKIRAAAKSPEHLRDELRSILGKIHELPASARLRAFTLLFAYLKLRRARLSLRFRSNFTWILVVVGTLMLWSAGTSYYRSVRYEKCLIKQPSLTRHLFRPAEDCSMCRDIRRIEKISNVDQKLFEERYAYTGHPVVVTDAAANWTAMGLFSFAFLKDLYQGQDANCQFFPYKTEFQSLQDVFNMSVSRALMQAGTKPWYVGWSNCDETIGAVLRQHYQRPYFLPDTAESEKTDWIFMGSPGYGAPMHVDDVEYPSWQAQIRGHKTWILEPPRECHYSCDRLEVTVNPGEIIVLDTNKWYHQTLIVSEDISITIGAEYD